ncbi:glycosyltransferase [Patescibacteria group bacterium]|nr:glycosyltransferase [Patescibacteria group bacterium]
MKLHYISCHSILEYDEVKLFTEMGIDVFSNGAYIDPKGHITLPRPAIEGMVYHEDLAQIARSTPRTELPPELIEPFDVIMIMHSPDVLFQNWQRIKHKRVIFRSIGQSTGGLEKRLKPLIDEGLEVVRYSPMEKNLPNYAGETAMIRFYKDPDEFKDWNGDDPLVINFTQSLKGRRDFCHHDEIIKMMEGFNSKVYGNGNDDLGSLNGGELPYELMKGKMRDARAYAYGGTYPACYTLSFIEAMMTGIPILAIGKKTANIEKFEQLDFYEVDQIIEDGVNGFCSDEIDKLKDYISILLSNKDYAQKIGKKGRETAIKLFSKETIKNQWLKYLNLDK